MIFLRIIKNSVPEINNVMLIGCLISTVSVIVFGVDESRLSTRTFNFICQVNKKNNPLPLKDDKF